MSIPPPRGMSEVDYEAIEAAVTETVRGRWFLAEFARRNRVAETRQLLDAMARLEAAVAGGQTALPSADPSIRLLVARIKEIAARLGEVAGEMRASGVEEHFAAAVEVEARAVSGMMRAATPSLGGKPPTESARTPEPVRMPEPGRTPEPARMPEPTKAPEPRLPRVDSWPPAAASAAGDPRLAALAPLDNLSPSEKLALFR